MEVTGFGLSIIAEARTIVKSMKTRIAHIRHAPETFRSLAVDLDRLMRHIAEVETQLQSAPTAIPASISAVFDETLASVRDILCRSNSTVQGICSEAFPGSSCGLAARVKSLFRRTARATALNDAMNALQPQVQGASTQLLTLISILVTGLKSQEQQDAVGRITGNAEEVYRVGANTPALPQGANLNFAAKGLDGKHSTPEGTLKEYILSTESSSTITAAAGVLTAAHGIVGMAGVGKTVALQGLAFDEDIRIRFPHGAQYIALGQGATLSKAIEEVGKIMRLTGASASASAAERSSTLRTAVDYAVAWFKGKICLFLVDDLWPTKNSQTGFLNDLCQLLRCCPKSRMAITTRSLAIAHAAGCKVDFGSREPLGGVSVNIFMMHVTRDATRKAPQGPNGDIRKSVVMILSICAGLPLALAVAGCAVAFLIEEFGDVESACDAYASQLGKQRMELGEEQGPGGASLNARISLSLHILEDEFVKLKSRYAVDSEHTMAGLYASLCVLRHQAWVPVSVLSRMWKVDEDFALAAVRLLKGLSLCELTFRKLAQGLTREGGLMIHDLQLDFCKRQAEAMKASALWHTQLLNGYLEPVSGAGSFEHKFYECAPRPWWSITDDGYIHTDLARHLLTANLHLELAGLLLDARWTHVRAEIGGLFALKSDFECLLTLGGDIVPHRVRQGLELILKAIHLSWGRVSEGKRSLLFQVCGRLLNLRTGNAIVCTYLKSVETHTPVPYLLPVNPCFPDMRSAQVMEIPVGSEILGIDCSACGRVIAAGAGSDVVVADALTGNILKRLEGHVDIVTCVSFAVGSKKIVSGSLDLSVAVWEWETSASPVQFCQGHSELVTGVAVSSDSRKVFSCSCDRTLRIWDANTGTQLGEFLQRSRVRCVAVGNDDQSVGIGLVDGSVKVLDSRTGDTVFEDVNAHERRVSSIAFSETGQRLATVSWDNRIRVWNTKTWTNIGEPFQGHTDYVLCVTFSRDGQQIASGSIDCTVRSWDASSGRRIWTSSTVPGWVQSVRFTPDGGRIISGCLDGTIRIWESPVEAEANEPEYGHSAYVSAVAISQNGLRVASGSSDGTLCLWDACTGNQIGQQLEGHTSWVNCVSLSHDGKLVISGSFDKTVRLWDAETLHQIRDPLEGHTDKVHCVSISSDGLRIMSGSEDETVRVWDVESGMQNGDALQGHLTPVKAVSESCDGCHIVSRDIYDGVIIWNRHNRTIVWQWKQRLGESEEKTPIVRDGDTTYDLTDEEAEKIIRSCGEEAVHLWPDSFVPFDIEVYCRNSSVYANVPAEDTLLGTLPSEASSWKYSEASKVFVAGLGSSAVAVCNLKV